MCFLSLVWGLVHQPLPWHARWTWVPSLELELAFRVDGLSAQVLALITGIGFLIFVYASGYFAHTPRSGGLFLLQFLFWEMTVDGSSGFLHRWLRYLALDLSPGSRDDADQKHSSTLLSDSRDGFANRYQLPCQPRRRHTEAHRPHTTMRIEGITRSNQAERH